MEGPVVALLSQFENDPLLELSPSQQVKLTSLQQSLRAQGMWSEDRNHDLHMLRRFLKARQWDVDGAQEMWMNMLHFRSLNNVDRILTDFQFTEREAFLDAYPHGLHKVDRMFRPVIVYKLGSVDLDRLKAVTTEERVTLFHIQEYERIMLHVLPACCVASGCYVEQLVTLIDVGGLKMKDMMRVKDLLTGYIKVDSNNYPETLGAMVIINAPYWFSGMFSAIKSFLPPETQKKVQILGTNYHKDLFKLIAPENVHTDFGGTSTGRLRDNIGPWQTVLDNAKEAAEARQRALDLEDELLRGEENTGDPLALSKPAKKHRCALPFEHLHANGGALGNISAATAAAAAQAAADVAGMELAMAASREPAAAQFEELGFSDLAAARGHDEVQTCLQVLTPVDGGALLPQDPMLSPGTASTMQEAHRPATPPLSASHSGLNRHHHHREAGHSHKGGISPKRSATNSPQLHGSASSQQDSNNNQANSASHVGLPDLPFSSNPAQSIDLQAGPFASHQHQRATLEACLSWEASKSASGVSCYQSIDTEVTSAWRPPLATASSLHPLPPWHEPADSRQPLSPLGLAHPFNTGQPLPSTSEHSFPHATMPARLSASQCEGLEQHVNHHLNQHTNVKGLQYKNRRLTDAHMPQGPALQAATAHAQSLRHLPHRHQGGSERPRVWVHSHTRGGSADGRSSGAHMPDLHLLGSQRAQQASLSLSHPVTSTLAHAYDQRPPSIAIGLPDHGASSEVAVSALVASTAVVAPPLSCNSIGRQGPLQSMCSARSDESTSSGCPRVSTNSQNQGSVSPSHSYVSANGILPAGNNPSSISSISGSPGPTVGAASSLQQACSLPVLPSLQPRLSVLAAQQQNWQPHTLAGLPLPLYQQPSSGAHPSPRPSDIYDIARLSFHSCASADSTGLQSLNSLGGGSSPGGTPHAAYSSYPWLNPPTAALTASVAAHGNRTCHPMRTIHNKSGSRTMPGSSWRDRHGDAGQGAAAAAFSSGQEQQPEQQPRGPPSRMFSLQQQQQQVEQAQYPQCMLRQNSIKQGRPNSGKLGALVNRLRNLSGRRKQRVSVGDHGRYVPLLEQPLAPRNSKPQWQQRRHEGLKMPVAKVTSNPLGNEGAGDLAEGSSAACDWEWDDMSEQPGLKNKGHALGVTWAPSTLQHSVDGDDCLMASRRLHSTASFHSNSSFGGAAAVLQEAHQHDQHQHSRCESTPILNMVLPSSCEPGTSTFGSRRTSNRSSRPLHHVRPSHHGPRYSTTSWYGSCDEGRDCVDEAGLEDEGEEGGLLGHPRSSKSQRKKSGMIKRLGKKILPCCFIQ